MYLWYIVLGWEQIQYITCMILRYTKIHQNLIQGPNLVVAVTHVIMVLVPLTAIASLADMCRSLNIVSASMRTAVYRYAIQSTNSTSCFKIMSENSRVQCSKKHKSSDIKSLCHTKTYLNHAILYFTVALLNPQSIKWDWSCVFSQWLQINMSALFWVCCVITIYYALTIHYICLAVPSAPSVIPEECSAEQNTVTVSWQTHEASSTAVDGYILELAEVAHPEFRVRKRKEGYLLLCMFQKLPMLTRSVIWIFGPELFRVIYGCM